MAFLSTLLTFLVGILCGAGMLAGYVYWSLHTAISARELRTEQLAKSKAEAAAKPPASPKQSPDVVSGTLWLCESSEARRGEDNSSEATLRQNTLMLRDQDGKVRIVNMDGTDVSLHRVRDKWGKVRRPWDDKNWIIVASESRPVVPNTSVMKAHIYAPSARELEKWFLGLMHASRIRQLLADPNAQPSWIKHYQEITLPQGFEFPNEQERILQTVFSRVFWDMSIAQGFLDLIGGKIEKKLKSLNHEGSTVRKVASLKSLEFGRSPPCIHSLSNFSTSNSGSLGVDFEVEYTGGFQLEIMVDVTIDMINTVLPVNVKVLLRSARGKARLEITGPGANSFWLGFHGEPTLDLNVTSEVFLASGILPSIPLNNATQIANAFVTEVKRKLLKSMVLPSMEDFTLPFAD